MKKKLLLITIFGSLFTLFIAANGVQAIQDFIYKDNHKDIANVLVEDAKKVKEDLKDTKVIAKIDDESITYSEFTLKKLMMDTEAKSKNKKPLTNKEIFDQILTDKVTVKMAREFGVYPTDQEIIDEITKIKNEVLKADPNDPFIKAFTDQYGLSIDEFFYEWQKPLYTQGLINQRVGEIIAKDVKKEPSESQNDYIKAIFKHYKNLVDSKKAKADVKIIDNSLGL